MKTEHESFMDAVEGGYDRTFVLRRVGEYLLDRFSPSVSSLDIHINNSFERYGLTQQEKTELILDISRICLNETILIDMDRADRIDTPQAVHEFVKELHSQPFVQSEAIEHLSVEKISAT